MLTAEAELERFLQRRAVTFAAAMREVAISLYEGGDGSRQSIEFLADLLQRTLILADLHGRRRALMEADAARRRMGKLDSLPTTTPIVPSVPFEEAIDDLLRREPRLAKSFEEVSKLYSKGKVFSLAKSASLKLTERIQKEIVDITKSGRAAGAATRDLVRIAAENSHNWTVAYADTVYQTNTSDAYTQGRFKQALDPDVRDVVPALEVTGIADDDERPNHRALRGFLAAADDPQWARLRPPYGYKCRHGVRLVPRSELERRGLLDANGRVIPYYPPNFEQGGPDPGFRSGGF